MQFNEQRIDENKLVENISIVGISAVQIKQLVVQFQKLVLFFNKLFYVRFSIAIVGFAEVEVDQINRREVVDAGAVIEIGLSREIQNNSDVKVFVVFVEESAGLNVVSIEHDKYRPFL